MSHQAQSITTPLPVGTSVFPGSLRAEMESRRAAGETFSIKEAIGIIVPLCTQLAEIHAQGRTCFVHPSALRYTREVGVRILDERALAAPALPRDRACLAPEERKGEPGDARASVFSIGAILYELLTAASVGPGMRRPAELVSNLPPQLEVILGKALVADPKHRPADLGALAQALHHVAPTASMPPPPADESHLDHDEDFEVDIRLSMMPPNEVMPPVSQPIPRSAPVPQIHAVQGDGPFAVAIQREVPSRRDHDPTQRLAHLKASLEADPRPRYVVVKEGMDHGPFSAVELLQQIASGAFTGENALRDAFSNEERVIKDWEEFAPFAEQAKLHRDMVKEKQAFEAVVVAEKKSTQYKALIGVAMIGIVAAGGTGWWMRERRNKEHEREVHDQKSESIDIDGGLRAGKAEGPNSGGGIARNGNYPVLGGGMSCEAARAKYVENFDKVAPPDLSAGAYGAVLNKGTYLQACGVPGSMGVTICAAVQNGRAVGVTVTTNPKDAKIASCISGQIRSMSFPSHPRLDVTTTTF